MGITYSVTVEEKNGQLKPLTLSLGLILVFMLLLKDPLNPHEL